MIKSLLGGTLLAALLAACGGSPKSPASESLAKTAPPPSRCATAMDHVRAELATLPSEELSADEVAIITRVLTERCEQDAWAPEVIACFETAVGDNVKDCAEQLTDEQEQAADDQIERELGDKPDEETAADVDEPASTGAAPTSTQEGGSGRRSPAPPKKGAPAPDDPCGGGAGK